MIRILENRVAGSVFHVDSTGESMKRVFVVQGLPSTADILARAVIAQDGVSGYAMPQVGQEHELITGQYVTSIDSEPFLNSTTKAIVTATYGWWVTTGPNSIIVRINSSSCNIPMNFDPVNGKPFYVKWTDPQAAADIANQAGSSLGGQPSDASATATGISLVTINAFIDETVVEMTRVETKSPLAIIPLYKNRTNKTAWQGQPPNTWLMREITAESIGQNRYNVTYAASMRPPIGWTQLYFFVEHYSGKVPEAVLTQGLKLSDFQNALTGPVTINGNKDSGVFVYNPLQAEFNALKLPNVY